MANTSITYQLDIYNAAGTSVAITWSSIAGGTNPYLSDQEPVGDGQEINPLTGSSRRGQYTGRVIDVITSGTTRLVTGSLEDANYRQQLMRRKAILKMILDGTTTVVLCAGLLTDLRLVNALEYQYTVTDRTRVQSQKKVFMPRAAAMTLTADALSGATSIAVSPLPVAVAKHERLNFGAGKTTRASAAAAAGATSVSVTALPLAMSSGDTATYREPVSAFLARWPKRGCILGGPVIGGFLDQQDSGGWTMRYELYDGAYPFLRFKSGRTAAGGIEITDVSNEYLGPTANRAAGKFSYLTPDEALVPLGPVHTFEQASTQALANDLLLEVLRDGSTVGYFRASFSPFDLPRADVEVYLVDLAKNRQGIWLRDSAGLSVGVEYRVRAFTATVSEISPIYADLHPVDWVTTILTELGYAYDSTSASTIKGTIGNDFRVAHRIPQPQNGAAWLEQEILGPFGIGLRMGDDAEIELVSTRIFTNSAPSTTITDDDVITPEEGGAGEVFAISESTAVASAVFNAKKFESLTAFSQRTGQVIQDIPADGILVSDVRIERLNGDPGVVGDTEHSWTISGMVHRLDSYEPANDFLDLAIREIFDRFGRGVIECELPLIRGGSGDALRIGDECIVRVKQLPNRNKRYGDDNSVGGRAMQIVRYTPRASGALVKLLDSGPNANAYGTAATISIAAGSTGNFLPKRVAYLTITNAATLNADAAGAYVLMAVTTGGAAGATDYSRVISFAAGEIPTSAFKLPTVIGGRTVYAKVVATKAGYRPASASAAANVSLTAISPPTGVSATPDGTDGTTVVVDWTPGETDHFTDIYRRPTALSSSENVRIAELAPDSVQFTDTTAQPGVAYTYSVQHRHPQLNDTSSLVTDTATTVSTIDTIDPPTGVRFFAGPQDASFNLDPKPGLYGIAVRAALNPAEIEAEVSEDSGTTWSSIGQVPARQGTWTPVADIGKNDGTVLQLRARVFRPGHNRRDCIASYSTGEVASMSTATAAALSASVSASTWSDVVTGTAYSNTAIQKTTKTIRIYAGQFSPVLPATTIWNITIPGATLTGAGAAGGYASVPVPLGATMTAIRMRSLADGADAVGATLYRVVDGSSSTLATLSNTGVAGYQTTSASFTEEVDGTATYAINAALSGNTTVVFQYVDIDYTSPALDVSL